MKFHVPSFLLGVAAASAAMSARARLRPVIVEIGALGAHLSWLGRGLIERQREQVEDLWAEIEERARGRARGDGKRAVEPRVPSGNGIAGGVTHGAV